MILKTLILLLGLYNCGKHKNEPKNNLGTHIKVPKYLPFNISTKIRRNIGSEHKSLSINFTKPIKTFYSSIFLTEDLQKIFFNGIKNGHLCFNFNSSKVFTFRNIPSCIINIISLYSYGIELNILKPLKRILEKKGYILYITSFSFETDFFFNLPDKNIIVWISNKNLKIFETYLINSKKNKKKASDLGNYDFKRKINLFLERAWAQTTRHIKNILLQKNPIVNILDSKSFKISPHERNVQLDTNLNETQKILEFLGEKRYRLHALYYVNHDLYIPISYQGSDSLPFDCVYTYINKKTRFSNHISLKFKNGLIYMEDKKKFDYYYYYGHCNKKQKPDILYKIHILYNFKILKK